MKRQIAYAVVAACALQLAACRQADGPMPEATPSTPNELGDISRDLQNVASGDPSGPKELSDDLSHYAQGSSGGPPAAAELSRRLSEALTGKTFKLAQAIPVAHTAWVAVAARQLSEKQIEALQNEMKSGLMSIGASEQQAQNVADQVGAVQQAVTRRHRRWYELL
ncbi:MAG TPA: hypothetical protein VN654_12000 [Vicinamibacterales bacterium]|nr:hypothetical protein [Vicinamibacterales bacterium]